MIRKLKGEFTFIEVEVSVGCEEIWIIEGGVGFGSLNGSVERIIEFRSIFDVEEDLKEISIRIFNISYH